MPKAIASFLAIMLTALSMVPAGAHLAELLHKMPLGRDEYLVVQGIYRGWSLFGIALFGAVIANLLLAVLVRKQPVSCGLAVSAGLLTALTLAVFFTWTFPVNQKTDNWTVAPANWEALRRQWEYSHAANATLLFIAFTLSILAGLTAKR